MMQQILEALKWPGKLDVYLSPNQCSLQQTQQANGPMTNVPCTIVRACFSNTMEGYILNFKTTVNRILPGPTTKEILQKGEQLYSNGELYTSQVLCNSKAQTI